MSFLSTIGKDFKAVFTWLGSPKGQALIQTGGTILSTVNPALGGVVALAESWIQKVIVTETLATAAGSQTGSSAQKAAAVLAAIGPEVSKYFPNAKAEEIAAANTAIVAFLNAFSTPPVVPATK